MPGYRLDQKAKEDARKAQNKYAREWRAANREKVKQYNERYWMKRAQRDAEPAS